MRVWIEANELMDEHQAVNRYYRDEGSGEESLNNREEGKRRIAVKNCA